MVMRLAMVSQLTGEVETVCPRRSKIRGGQKPQLSTKAQCGEFFWVAQRSTRSVSSEKEFCSIQVCSRGNLTPRPLHVSAYLLNRSGKE